MSRPYDTPVATKIVCDNNKDRMSSSNYCLFDELASAFGQTSALQKVCVQAVKAKSETEAKLQSAHMETIDQATRLEQAHDQIHLLRTELTHSKAELTHANTALVQSKIELATKKTELIRAQTDLAKTDEEFQESRAAIEAAHKETENLREMLAHCRAATKVNNDKSMPCTSEQNAHICVEVSLKCCNGLEDDKHALFALFRVREQHLDELKGEQVQLKQRLSDVTRRAEILTARLELANSKLRYVSSSCKCADPMQ